jgi:hypothetical protein
VVRQKKPSPEKAFDRALQRELEAVILESKQMVEKINQPSDLWDFGTLSDPAPRGDRPQV